MPFFNNLGAAGFVALSCFVVSTALAGEHAVKPVSFNGETQESNSALSRYAPRFVERPVAQVNAVLSLTQPAASSSDVASSQSESKLLEAVLSGSHDRSSAALVKDCTLTAPIPSTTFARDVVAVR
jgi:hypothetical protein